MTSLAAQRQARMRAPNETLLLEIGVRAYWYLYLENSGNSGRKVGR